MSFHTVGAIAAFATLVAVVCTAFALMQTLAEESGRSVLQEPSAPEDARKDRDNSLLRKAI